MYHNTYHEEIATSLNTDTSLVCCGGSSQCEKARMLMPELPKLLRDFEISELFNLLEFDEHERRIRAIYLGANFEDEGALFKKIAQRPDYVRSQAEFAVDVTGESSFRTPSTRYEVGMLVARVFAGTGCRPCGLEPRKLEPERVSHALEAISIDCFAGLAEQRLIQSGKAPLLPDDQGADAVELGLLAIIRFLSQAGLSRGAFRRLMGRASTRLDHLVTSSDRAQENTPQGWPPALGWDDGWRRGAGAAVKPLLSIQALRSEGAEMDNCLVHGVYDRAALQGQLAFFSIVTYRARATLSLRLSTRQDDTGQIVAQAYEISHLQGPGNSPAAVGCERAAVNLLEQLNAGLPCMLDESEIDRRKAIDACFPARRNSFCRDLELAEDYWKRIYLPTLPSRFRRHALAEIIDRVQDYKP